MLNLKTICFGVCLVCCLVCVGCKKSESGSEGIAELKSRKAVSELVDNFVRVGQRHRETSMEADTMPPVVPRVDGHHIEWSGSLFTPALKALIEIGEPSVPYLLPEYQNKDKKNRPFTVKSAGWAIIHIGEPALAHLEDALKTGSDDDRLSLTVMTCAIADKSQSAKAIEILKALQTDASEKVQQVAVRYLEEHKN